MVIVRSLLPNHEARRRKKDDAPHENETELPRPPKTPPLSHLRPTAARHAAAPASPWPERATDTAAARPRGRAAPGEGQHYQLQGAHTDEQEERDGGSESGQAEIDEVELNEKKIVCKKLQIILLAFLERARTLGQQSCV